MRNIMRLIGSWYNGITYDIGLVQYPHRAEDRIVGCEGARLALDAQSIILDFFWLCAENARVRGADAAILDFFTRCAKRSVSTTT